MTTESCTIETSRWVLSEALVRRPSESHHTHTPPLLTPPHTHTLPFPPPSPRQMIKKFHGQMEHLKETTALKLKEVMYATQHTHTTSYYQSIDRVPFPSSESPRDRVHGFQDFISPPKGGKKKRNLPLAPRQRRGRAASQDEGMLVCTMYNYSVVPTFP